MKIGIGLPNVIPGTEGRRLVGWAQRAEDLGFDSLGVIDGVVYDSYEALLALAMAAAVTERIELVTNVVIAPLRNTGMLAKQAVSLDRASGGRLTLGLALGARDDDFVACGLPTRGRGRTLDAQLGELRRIWQGTDIGPAPARPGGPRMLLGGGARHAGPRAARHGDGWTMMVGTPTDFAAGIEVVRDCWTAAGRLGTPATMAVFYAALGDDAPHLVEQAVGGYYAWLGRDIAGYIVGTAASSEAQVHERLAGFAAAGADEVMVLPCAADPAQLERLAAAALRAPHWSDTPAIRKDTDMSTSTVPRAGFGRLAAVLDGSPARPGDPDPSLIMQVGMGFWPSKTLLTAVELGLFTALGTGASTADELADTLDLRSRAVADFLDGLVALRLLERDGSGAAASYRNTSATAAFLDATSPRYMGGFLEMSNARLYGFWANPDRGAADRPPAERDQTHRAIDVRRALRRPRPP